MTEYNKSKRQHVSNRWHSGTKYVVIIEHGTKYVVIIEHCYLWNYITVLTKAFYWFRTLN